MLSATVAQNPTMPVNEGTKNLRNSPVVWNFEGLLSTGPKPPALRVIHQSSSRPTPNMKGAPMPSSTLMVSIPRQITNMFNSQNSRKHTQGSAALPAIEGMRIDSME